MRWGLHLACALLLLLLVAGKPGCASPPPQSAQRASFSQTAVTPSDAQVSRTRLSLEKALQRGEFAPDPPEKQRLQRGLRQLLLAVQQAIARFLSWLFGGVGAGGRSWEGLSNGLLIIVGALAVAAIVMALLRRLRRGAAALPSQATEAMTVRVIASASDWLVRAREHQARGDDRAALRCLYLGLLRRLHESGAVRIEPGQTNWEILRGLRGHARQADALDATRLFEASGYAMRPVGPDDFERMLAHFQRAAS